MFDPAKYSIQTFEHGGQTIVCRAYEDIVYVSQPVDIDCQIMDIYIPEAYFKGGSIGANTAGTAPIFFPNAASAYLPAKPIKPRVKKSGAPNASLAALSKGYVVASPGLRGRSLQNAGAWYTGKAPACIVDLKAAVRFLRRIGENLPGDTERIISNGFSAGGALSALLGATGNSEDYEPYLKEIGAAATRDDIFAASCYCPVTNLENSDGAYEWQFCGLGIVEHKGALQVLTAEQIKISKELKSLFPAYLNSQKLNWKGDILTLKESGDGSFLDYVKSFLIDSARQASHAGKDISGFDWLTMGGDGIVTDADFEKYIRYIGRVKAPPAFDALDGGSPECGLFGTKDMDGRHFTTYSAANSLVGIASADETTVRLMNPMSYIGSAACDGAHYWRIRQGTLDRGSAIAVPLILSAKLQNEGFDADCALAWGQPHGGDYDLEELFFWIDKICGFAG